MGWYHGNGDNNEIVKIAMVLIMNIMRIKNDRDTK